MVTLLQILHWFNPLVWFAFARMRADRELVWGDKGGHIKVRELATGTAQRIVSASEKEKTYEFPSGVIWSPNRAMVGYVVITTEAGTTTEQLHVAATDGSWDRIVKTAGQLVRGGIPNWAPDSAAVLLTLRENLPGEIGLLENFLPVEKKVAAK